MNVRAINAQARRVPAAHLARPAGLPRLTTVSRAVYTAADRLVGAAFGALLGASAGLVLVLAATLAIPLTCMVAIRAGTRMGANLRWDFSHLLRAGNETTVGVNTTPAGRRPPLQSRAVNALLGAVGGCIVGPAAAAATLVATLAATPVLAVIGATFGSSIGMESIAEKVSYGLLTARFGR